MFELFVLGVSSFVNIALGLTVYLKKPKSATSRLFLLLTSSFVLWSVVNYISVHPFLFSQIVWVRLVLSCAAMLCLSVFLTFTVFPSHSMVGSKRLRRLAIGYTGFVMLFVLSPYVFTVNGAGDPIPNKGIVFFTILVIGLLGGGIVTLAKKYRSAVGKTKNQLRLVVLGLAGTFGLIFINNFLLVVVFHFTGLIAAGPAFTLIFSSSIAYAIIKHRLFDIRTAVARATAYVLSLGSIILVYSLVVFGISENLTQNATTTVS